MTLPGVYLTRQDGGLRLPGQGVDGLHLKIGPAYQGTVNVVGAYGNLNDTVADFKTGPLVDSAAIGFEKLSLQYLMRCAASTAGTYPTRTRVHAAVLATLAGGPPTPFPGPFTLATDSNIECDFAAGWDGGNILITGTDLDGNAQTETLTAAAGTTVKGVKVFKAGSITAMSKSLVGVAASAVNTFQGTKTKAATGTNSKFTVTGTPTDAYRVRVRMTTGGDVAAGTPAFEYSLDGGNNYVGPVLVPAGGVYTVDTALGTGLTFTFVGTATVATDAFAQDTVAPTFNNTDLTNALTAANASVYDFECIHIIGTVDATFAATISTFAQAAEVQNTPKWYVIIVEPRDIGTHDSPAETETAWKTAISGVSPGFVNVADYRIGAVAGYGEVLSPLTGRIQRRSLGSTYAARLMSISVGTSPAQTSDGPVSGVSALYHDEGLSEGLNNERFTTFRTYGKQLPGYFVTLGLQLKPNGSDYRKVQSLRTVNKCMRLTYSELLYYIESKVKVNSKTGRILEKQAVAIELPIVTLLKEVLGDDITEPRVTVDRTVNIITTSKLVVTVGIVPVGYAEFIYGKIGLLNPALEIV